jgi:hypothetical protein
MKLVDLSAGMKNGCYYHWNVEWGLDIFAKQCILLKTWILDDECLTYIHRIYLFFQSHLP